MKKRFFIWGMVLMLALWGAQGAQAQDAYTDARVTFADGSVELLIEGEAVAGGGMTMDFGTLTLPGDGRSHPSLSAPHGLTVSHGQTAPVLWSVYARISPFTAEGGAAFDGSIRLQNGQTRAEHGTPGAQDVTVSPDAMLASGLGEVLVMKSNVPLARDLYHVIWSAPEDVQFAIAPGEDPWQMEEGAYTASITWTVFLSGDAA